MQKILINKINKLIKINNNCYTFRFKVGSLKYAFGNIKCKCLILLRIKKNPPPNNAYNYS